MRDVKSGEKEHANSRREFFKGSAKAIAGIGAAALAGDVSLALGAASGSTAKGHQAKVAFVRAKNPIPKGDAGLEIISRMIDEGVKFISGHSDPAVFWKQNFSARDRVSIKVNTVTWKGSPLPQISEAVAKRLGHAGIAADNILVWDRDMRGLKQAGLGKSKSYRCGAARDHGYMENAITSGKVTTRYTKILDEYSALINIPILKSHQLAGITASLKNHYGSFEDPNKYHANSCDPFIADINAVDIIKKKTRIVICDAVKVLYAAGPEWTDAYAKEMNGILVSTDPVALDAAGYNIIKKIRKEAGGHPPVMFDPKWIKTAAAHGIGVADHGAIDFKEIMV